MGWSSDLVDVRNKYEDIGKKFHSHMYNCWNERKFPTKAWDALSHEGFFNACVRLGPKKGVEWICAAVHGFCKGSQDIGFSCATVAQAAMAIPLLQVHGTVKAKKKYLKNISDGKAKIAFAVTEAANGGTNAFNPDCELSEKNSRTVLNGQKWHITNAEIADVYFIFCRRAGGGLICAIVDRNSFGLTIKNDCMPAGARTSPVASIEFKNVFVPEENIIKFDGAGAVALNKIFVGERICAAYPAVAAMENAIDKAFAFIAERKVNNQKLIDAQHKQAEMIKSQRNLDIVKLMARNALDQFIAGRGARKESSMVKWTAVEYLDEVLRLCRSACASYGAQMESQFGMWMHDCYVGEFAGGTKEAHWIIILEEMLREHTKRSKIGNIPSMLISNEKPWKESSALSVEELPITQAS